MFSLLVFADTRKMDYSFLTVNIALMLAVICCVRSEDVAPGECVQVYRICVLNSVIQRIPICLLELAVKLVKINFRCTHICTYIIHVSVFLLIHI